MQKCFEIIFMVWCLNAIQQFLQKKTIIINSNTMGLQESRVQLCTQDQYKMHNQNRVKSRDQFTKRKKFFQIEECQYPHPLIEQNHTHNQQSGQQTGHHHKCTMKHAGYPDTYHLCSKCQQHPQKLRKNSKITYVQENYNLPSPSPPKYNYKPAKYKEKDILAPGPQIPTFYNGFSLPLDRYYKQRTQFTDYSPEPAKAGSPYREQSHSFEQSVYQEVSDRKHSIQHEKEIDFDGHVQNLKF